VNQWRFGDITIDRVVEAEMPTFKPAVLLPDASDEIVERHREWLEPHMLDPRTGHLVMSFHSFVIRTPRTTILVDTCGGNDKPRPQKARYHMKNHPYLERLAAIGLEPEQVDYVMCTHLHVDHVGWNTRLVNGRWVPTFPNARYLFSRIEWEFWQQHYRQPDFRDDPYHEDSILPVIAAGKAQFVEFGHQIDDGVWIEPTPGHTPGHVCVHVSSGQRDAVMSGDLMHHVLQCLEPDLSSAFCVDPAHSRRTRRQFLERFADTETLIMPAHFAEPSAGRVRGAHQGFGFVFDGPHGRPYS
jgi:glyoxylase-like metal-dependent hydrolase (beta-lactamase superfamily II)